MVTRIIIWCLIVCLFIYLFYFLQTFQLTDELQAFSAEVRDASVDSLEKSLTSYHVVSVVVEGILALCKEVSVLFLSASDVLRPISYQVWEKRRRQAFSCALRSMLNFSLSSDWLLEMFPLLWLALCNVNPLFRINPKLAIGWVFLYLGKLVDLKKNVK